MVIDKRTLNLIAAVTACVSSGIALSSALFGRNRGSGAVLPALLGVAGSAARVMSALQDVQEGDTELA